MSVYSIRELERLSGVKAPTIRIWEKRYGVVRPKRTSTNIRYYCDQDLRKLINLAILNRQGYRISKLAELSDEELGKMAMKHSLDHPKADDRCDLLTQAMLRVDERDFERVFERLEAEEGFEGTIFRYIIPFLKKVGTLWHTGAIDPAQEHFVSQLVRRKLMSAIEACRTPDENSPSYLMFLPEGEYHDIGLLFSYYLARKEGFRVCYLGASVPDEDLKRIGQQYHYPRVITAFIDPIGKKGFEERLRNYLFFFPDSELIVTGPQIKKGLPVENDRLHVIESVEAFRDELKGSTGSVAS
jgi:DNA-binding transcriptional MerR regulator